MYWWQKGSPYPNRLQLELLALGSVFSLQHPVRVEPQTSWDSPYEIITLRKAWVNNDPAYPYFDVSFRMREVSVSSRINTDQIYRLKITTSPNYPEKYPTVTLPDERLDDNTPHLFLNGAICLHEHDGVRSREWDPSKSTCATYGLWSTQWIRAWQYWKQYGRWPDAS